MRISTNTIFELGSTKISDLQAQLTRTQQQLSTQRRVLTPADDPVAAANIIGITQSISINEQFATNRQNAKNLLSQQESILQSVTSLLQDTKTLVVNAGDGALEDSQRQFLTAELRGLFDELLGLANSRDGAGNYMVGGYQIDSQPFSQTPTGAAYSGDQGKRMLQIGASRHIAMNDSGSSIFENIKVGNGRFVTAPENRINPATFAPIVPASANAGSGIVSSGAVVDATKLTGDSYNLVFSVVPSAVPANAYTPNTISYAIQNSAGDFWNSATSTWVGGPPPVPVAGAAPAAPWTPYVSGQAIIFEGLQFDVKGTPADGDAFSIKPSSNQSIFETMTNLLATLSAGSVGATGQANLTNGLNAANNNIDNALSNVLQVRASVGTRLKEIEVLDSTGDDLHIQYTEAINQLQEIDLAETISNFTQQQMALEAAQKSFMQVSRLSLFNYL